MTGADRGTSETLGALLMTAIAVTAVTVGAGALFLADAPTDHPQAVIDAGMAGTDLVVEHRAGEVLDAATAELVLGGTGERVALTDGTVVTGDDDGLFEPGERWRFDLASEGRPTSVSLVVVEDRRVLVDSADIENATTDAPTTVATTTTTDTGPTTTTTSTTTTGPTVERFDVEDISDAHAVRFQIHWSVAGPYDDVVFRLYRDGGEDWTLVDTARPNGWQRFFGWPTRVVDGDHPEGTYRVVMWVTVEGQTTTRQVERTVDAPNGPGDGTGGDGRPGGGGSDGNGNGWWDRWWDWVRSWGR